MCQLALASRPIGRSLAIVLVYSPGKLDVLNTLSGIFTSSAVNKSKNPTSDYFVTFDSGKIVKGMMIWFKGQGNTYFF